MLCVCFRVLVERQVRPFSVATDDSHSARKEIRHVVYIRCMFVTRRNRYEIWAVDDLALFEIHGSEVDRASNVEFILSEIVCVYTQTPDHAPREDKPAYVDVDADTSACGAWVIRSRYRLYRPALGTIQRRRVWDD